MARYAAALAVLVIGCSGSAPRSDELSDEPDATPAVFATAGHGDERETLADRPDAAAPSDAGSRSLLDFGPASDVHRDGGTVIGSPITVPVPSLHPVNHPDIPEGCQSCAPATQFCQTSIDYPDGHCYDCTRGIDLGDQVFVRLNCDGPWPIFSDERPSPDMGCNTDGTGRDYAHRNLCDHGTRDDPGAWCCMMSNPPGIHCESDLARCDGS